MSVTSDALSLIVLHRRTIATRRSLHLRSDIRECKCDPDGHRSSSRAIQSQRGIEPPEAMEEGRASIGNGAWTPAHLGSAVRALWCARRDSNPHDFTHCHLKAARLPIPPRALLGMPALGGK